VGRVPTLGAMLPFLFSSMAMKAVGDAAMDMIQEVRRQFREIPSLRPALDLVKAAEDADRAHRRRRDPDTAGPSLIILIKVMSIVAVVIAPFLVG
jgi:Na+/H+-translocating membrane pyrophosphatase